jgi:hypothetical protein
VEEQQLRNWWKSKSRTKGDTDDVLLEDIMESDAIGEDAANKAPVIRLLTCS